MLTASARGGACAAVSQWVRGFLEPVLTGSLRRGLRWDLMADTAGTLVLNVASFGCNLAIAVLLARSLGQSGYGSYAYALALAVLLSVPALLGLTQLLVRDISAYAAKSEWSLIRGLVRRSHQAVVVASVTVVAGGAVLGWALTGTGRSEDLYTRWIGLLLVPILALTTLRHAVMQAFRRVVLGRVPETIVQPLLFVALILVVPLIERAGLTPPLAMALHVLSAFTALVLGWVLLKRTIPGHVKSAAPRYHIRAWARSALPLLVLSAIWVANSQISIAILGAMQPEAAVGLFSVAAKSAGFVSFLFGAANYPLSPAVARLYAAGDKVKLQRLLTQAARWVAAVSIPVALMLVLLGDQVLSFFGPGFSDGRGALTILAIGESANVLTGMVAQALIMTGHERDVAWTMGAGALWNVLVAVTLIPPLGADGAAIATMTSVVGTNLVMVVRLWRRSGIYAPAVGVRLFTGRRAPR